MNKEVLTLQRKLNELGYGPIAEDGQYGKNTEAAYRRYLDEIDPEVPTVIPAPETKWWMSKPIIAAAATILVSIVSIFGYQLDLEMTSQMLFSLITLVTGIASIYGTVKNGSQIDKVHINPLIKKNEDSRGVFTPL